MGERVFKNPGVCGQALPSFNPHPAPSTFLLSPHFSRGPNAKTSFARPEFRSRRSGTLATQASVHDSGYVLTVLVEALTDKEANISFHKMFLNPHNITIKN